MDLRERVAILRDAWRTVAVACESIAAELPPNKEREKVLAAAHMNNHYSKSLSDILSETEEYNHG